MWQGRLDVLLTMGRNIGFPQNLAVLPFGIIVPTAHQNEWRNSGL